MRFSFFNIIMSLLTLLALTCVESNNPADGGDQNGPPEIQYETSKTSFQMGDTTHFDSGTVTLTGNSTKSEFQVKMNDGSWTEWEGAKSYKFQSMSDGKQVLHIRTHYSGSSNIVEDSLIFYVKGTGYRPLFSVTSDTTISVKVGADAVISSHATGADSINYQWFKDSAVVRYATEKNHPLKSVVAKDAGKYFCIATNKYGSDTGRVITLKVKLSQGSISGIVADNGAPLKDVRVTLLPDTTDTVTGNNGKFSFAGLSEGTYRLHIKSSKYYDTTISDISVKDTGVTAKGTINLKLKSANDMPRTLTYNGNGNDDGDVPVDTNSHYAGDSVVIKENSDSLEKAGYNFAGWNTKKDGSGTTYHGGDKLAFDTMNVVLYARWTDVPVYTVTYYAPGKDSGTVPVDTRKYEKGATATIRSNSGSLKKDGYSFIGWNSAEDGSGTSFVPGDTFTIDTVSIKLYVKWSTVPTHSVTYYAPGVNSGEVPVDNKKYEKGATLTVRSNSGSLKKDGYTFKGWNTAENGSGTTFLSGDTLVVDTSALKFYAQWSLNSYVIRYSGNGSLSGTPPADSSYKFGDSATGRPVGSLSKPGYSFVAWCSSADGNGTTVLEGKKFVVGAGDITLYAQWKVNKYIVTYYGNGNTDGTVPNPDTVAYGKKVKVSGNVGDLEKTGNTFSSWNTQADGNGTSYAPNDSLEIGTDNVKLYVKWETSKHKVYFNKRNGSPITNITVEYDDTVPTPTPPTKTGYIFSGWYKDSTCENLWNFASDKIKGQVTLFAGWGTPNGMVLIDANNETFTMGFDGIENDEKPTHQVKFTANFWMDSTEVTQLQYYKIMDSAFGLSYSSPEWSSTLGKGEKNPVYYANWYDAVLYCNARTKAIGMSDTFYSYSTRTGDPGDSCILTGVTCNWNSKGFRLPTEAQWEYACRANENKQFYWGKNSNPYPANVPDSNEVDSYAVWKRNSENKGSGNVGYGTHQVGLLAKNGYKLYDMSGNVAEWCNDRYGAYVGSWTAVENPKGPDTGDNRVIRGGSWKSASTNLRSYDRDSAKPEVTSSTVGFRTCLPAQ